MKKWKCFLLIVMLFHFCIMPVSASTNTFTRTRDNLLVSSDIIVTSQNLDAILNTPAVDASEKVYDFADLLTDSEEKEIYQEVLDFIDQADMDMAIVTIAENNKNNEVAYADDFYDYNDFGTDSSHSGILFLADMDNRVIYMSTTGQAISLYNDYRIEAIMDVIYQEFSDQNYKEGISSFINATTGYKNLGYLNEMEDAKYHVASDGEIVRTFPFAIVFGVPFVITFIVIGIMIYKNKLVRKATSSRNYLVEDSANVKILSDTLTSTYTSVTPRYNSNSDGGFGGSSTHSSSSGRSHGGGGHRF